MSPQDRDRLWKAALVELKTWTQMQRKLPAATVVYMRALRAVRKVAYETFGAHDQLPVIASEITEWLCKNFDPDKRRPQPKTSRAGRCLRDDAIARTYSEAEALGVDLSIRDLAEQFQLSPATIWRAVRKIKDASTGSGVQENAELGRFNRVILKLLPHDGKRAIDSSLLSEQLGIDDHVLWPRLHLFAETFPGWHFYPYNSEVVISRGRRLNQEQIFNWRSRAKAGSVIAPQRQLQDFGLTVWSDLLTIVAVWSGNASPDDWLEMIKVVTVKPTDLLVLNNPALRSTESKAYSMVDELVCSDPNILANRIRAAFKHRGGDDQIRSIEQFNREYTRDASVLAKILYLVEYSWGCDLQGAITIWLRVSSYGLRLQLGLLPGRDARDIETFMSAVCDFDIGDHSLHDLLRRYAR